MSGHSQPATDRRALLAGIGGLAAGTFLANNHAQAGSLTPPGAPNPTQKPLAEVEPRLAVSDEYTPGTALINHIISKPGSYYLIRDISGDAGATGISIEASGVTLDLNGFRLVGKEASSESAPAISCSPGVSNICIRNGQIHDWRGSAIDASQALRVEVHSVSIIGADFEDAILVGAGSLVSNCAISNCFVGVVTGPNCRVEHCRLSNLNGDGIQLNIGGVAIGCEISDGFVAGVRILGEGARVAQCEVRFLNGAGVHVAVGTDCVIESNSIRSCDVGFKVETDQNIIDSNSIRSCNVGAQIDGAGNIVMRNTTRNFNEYEIATNNKVAPIVTAPPSLAISGTTGAAGVGTSNPWANITF